mgnify:CR=1 FL=1
MTLKQQHIVAIGGLISEQNSLCLFSYILELAQVSQPKVGFLATAKGDADAFIQHFYKTFELLSCIPSHLPLFQHTPNIEAYINAQDVVLVSGGNTRSMLAVWREWGLPDVLKQAWQQGTVIAGWSAGAICWFEAGITDSRSADFDPIEGLGFLPGSCCPHYGEEARRRKFGELIQTGRLSSGVGIVDGVDIHYRGTLPFRVIDPDSRMGACIVQALDDDILETPLLIHLSEKIV